MNYSDIEHSFIRMHIVAVAVEICKKKTNKNI